MTQTAARAASAATPTRRPLLLPTALTLVGAAVVNLLLFLVGSAAGGAMAVHWPISQPIAAAAVPVATLVPTALAALVTWAIARRRPGFAAVAAWIGAAFAVLSMAAPLIGGDDLVTRLALAPMHLVAGIAWFVVARRIARRG